jgi:hypothetical protein
MKQFAIGAKVRVKFDDDYYEGIVVGRVGFKKSGSRAVKIKNRRYAIDFDDGDSLIVNAGMVGVIPPKRESRPRGRVARSYYPSPSKRSFGQRSGRKVVDVTEIKESKVDTRVPVFDPRVVVIHGGEGA